MNTEPIFITWKKYGFRHIIVPGTNVAHKQKGWDGELENVLYFQTFCNKHRRYPETFYEDAEGIRRSGSEAWIGTLGEGHALHDHRRPLCGTCRNGFKKLTGKDAE